MKKLSSLFIALVMTVFCMALFTDAVSLKLDGKPIPFEQPPVIIEGRTFVPFRAIFEALGAQVEWNDETKTATATKDDLKVEITIGEYVLYKNGEEIPLDVPAQIVGVGHTMVPARAIAESFGIVVEWENDAKSVILVTPQIKDEKEVVTMYAPDGRTITVTKTAIEDYKKVGWYIQPVVEMWLPDGTSKYIYASLIEEYKKLGWYTEPVVLMWAYDGRSKYVLKSQVEANKKVGWYDNKADVMETVYAPDGRYKDVFKARVPAEKSVGWMDRDEFEDYLQPWVEAYNQRLSNTYGSTFYISKSTGWKETYIVIFNNSKCEKVIDVCDSIGGKYNASDNGKSYYSTCFFEKGLYYKTSYSSINDVYNYLEKWFASNLCDVKIYTHPLFVEYNNVLYKKEDWPAGTDGQGVLLYSENGHHYIAVNTHNSYCGNADLLEITNVNGRLVITDIFAEGRENSSGKLLDFLDKHYTHVNIDYANLNHEKILLLTRYLTNSYNRTHSTTHSSLYGYHILKDCTLTKKSENKYFIHIETYSHIGSVISQFDINFSTESGKPIATSVVTRWCYEGQNWNYEG